jgi:hypothetical protein
LRAGAYNPLTHRQNTARWQSKVTKQRAEIVKVHGSFEIANTARVPSLDRANTVVNEFEVPFARKRDVVRRQSQALTGLNSVRSQLIQVIEGLKHLQGIAMQNMPFGSSPKFPGPSDEITDSCTPSST